MWEVQGPPHASFLGRVSAQIDTATIDMAGIDAPPAIVSAYMQKHTWRDGLHASAETIRDACTSLLVCTCASTQSEHGQSRWAGAHVAWISLV